MKRAESHTSPAIRQLSAACRREGEAITELDLSAVALSKAEAVLEDLRNIVELLEKKEGWRNVFNHGLRGWHG